MQAIAEPVEKKPAGQPTGTLVVFTHSLPGGHCVHTVEFASAYVPVLHAYMAAEDDVDGHANPAAQPVHTVLLPSE